MPDVKSMFVVSYDTPSQSRRSRMIRVLQRFGKRTHYSVFEVWLKPRDILRLLTLLQNIMNPEEDRFGLYPTDADQVWRIGAPLNEDEPTGNLIV